MHIREIVADIDAAIGNCQHIAANSPESISAQKAVHALHKNKARTKVLKKQKQAIAKSFRELDKSHPTFKKQKHAMQTVSTELKQLDNDRKQIEAKISDLFEDPAKAIQAPLPDFPSRFTRRPDNWEISAGHIKIERCEDPDLWDSYVTHHVNATVYHLYAWRQVIRQSFGHSGQYLVALNSDNKACGVLPLALIKSRLFGEFAISMPYFNYGGPLADSKDIEEALMEAAAVECTASALQHMEIRACRKINDWPTRKEKISMILSLPDSIAQLDSQLGSKIRAQIKQANAHQLDIKFGKTELLDDYYDVLAHNMRDLGTPIYGKSFFENILSTFFDYCTIAVIYDKYKPVSCAFLIGFGDMLEIPWASTLRSANIKNANMLLYKQILEFAISGQYRYFDFGRSSKNASTFRFKKQWGAQPVQHYWHYWLAGGQELPELNPANPKYQLLIKAWKILPVWATKIIGPSIVKSLP